MNGFERLLSCAGEWRGTNRVQPSVGDPVNESPSELTVVPILGGTFLRIDQRWSWGDTPQEGSMLIGYLPETDVVTVHWIDTWHNGKKSMTLTGRFESESLLVARGTFAVAAGPDWGWRIEIEPASDQLAINMFCVNPANQKDEGRVSSRFTRAAAVEG